LASEFVWCRSTPERGFCPQGAKHQAQIFISLDFFGLFMTAHVYIICICIYIYLFQERVSIIVRRGRRTANFLASEFVLCRSTPERGFRPPSAKRQARIIISLNFFGDALAAKPGFSSLSIFLDFFRQLMSISYAYVYMFTYF